MRFQRTIKLSLALSGVILAASLVAFRAQADSWDKMTRLTFSEPTQVMNTYLEPGTYMFKLANSDRHIVQIFTSDRSHLINTVFAIPDYRLNVTDRTQVTFWETPPGTAKAMRAWFWPGDHDGQEFSYPTQLRQIAAVTSSAPSPVQAPIPLAAAPAVTEPAPQPEAQDLTPQPQAQEQQPQEPVEIAQNVPPPAPAAPPTQAAPEQTPNSNSDNSSNELPKTASVYPLIGLGGVLALGLYFGLRVKQFR